VFADHWRPHVETPETWAAKQLGPQLRRDLSRVAVRADGSPAAFVVTWVEHDAPDQAYIALVGTARELRGRGVARALLADVLQRCAGAGLRRVVIDVDGDSPTHADRLYASLGCERASAATVWALQP
jgi:predicted GNAT superfamily acetyltransferase